MAFFFFSRGRFQLSVIDGDAAQSNIIEIRLDIGSAGSVDNLWYTVISSCNRSKFV